MTFPEQIEDFGKFASCSVSMKDDGLVRLGHFLDPLTQGCDTRRLIMAYIKVMHTLKELFCTFKSL